MKKPQIQLLASDAQSFEGQEQTAALLRILALGKREIEQDWYRSTADVFAELDAANDF